MHRGLPGRAPTPAVYVTLPAARRAWRESLLVWTTTPWTLAANVAAAVNPDLTYVRVRQGDDDLLPGRGRGCTACCTATTRCWPTLTGRATWSGWRYRGPFDELPAAAGRRAPRDRLGRGERRARAPASSISRPAAARRTSSSPRAYDLRRARADRRERHLRRRLRLADRPVRQRGADARSSPRCARRACSTAPRTTSTAIRTAGAAAPSWCSAWWTSGSSAMERAAPADDGRRRTRSPGSPSSGRERELDWLRNMGDWMISKKRYWGLALPIYECAACGHFEVIGGEDELHERAVEGWDEFEGHTPAPALGRRREDRLRRRAAQPVSRIADVGNPWLDAGIVPFSTLDYRHDRAYWAQVVPGRVHHRELPRPVPQLVLLAAGDGHGAGRTRRPSDLLRLSPRCSTRRAARCTRAGATPSPFDEARRARWAPTRCAGST